MLSHARLNNYHTPKQKILGNPSAQPAPAWKPNAKASSSNAEQGSKILLSRLPLDVVENEVEVLFARTVGPVKDVFMVYNSQGRSRGMAVVTFARPGDAAVARAKYNGKIVDGRRPIKIEIVVDDDDVQKAAPLASGMPSLLERLSPPKPSQNAAQTNARQPAAAKNAPTPAPAPNPKKRLRAKKGPRRLNKQLPQGQAQQQQPKQPPKKKTAEELDREMEEYRARAEGDSGKIKESTSMEVV
ncbi:hypothetical protein BV20DRAFT_970221 [Pilatotrama ljubarskyi]|nr:hypothetical protein BV20DRAFT_970221 [Pilatotrama ljubarskyi]